MEERATSQGMKCKLLSSSTPHTHTHTHTHTSDTHANTVPRSKASASCALRVAVSWRGRWTSLTDPPSSPSPTRIAGGICSASVFVMRASSCSCTAWSTRRSAYSVALTVAYDCIATCAATSRRRMYTLDAATKLCDSACKSANARRPSHHRCIARFTRKESIRNSAVVRNAVGDSVPTLEHFQGKESRGSTLDSLIHIRLG